MSYDVDEGYGFQPTDDTGAASQGASDDLDPESSAAFNAWYNELFGSDEPPEAVDEAPAEAADEELQSWIANIISELSAEQAAISGDKPEPPQPPAEAPQAPYAIPAPLPDPTAAQRTGLPPSLPDPMAPAMATDDEPIQPPPTTDASDMPEREQPPVDLLPTAPAQPPLQPASEPAMVTSIVPERKRRGLSRRAFVGIGALTALTAASGFTLFSRRFLGFDPLRLIFGPGRSISQRLPLFLRYRMEKTEIPLAKYMGGIWLDSHRLLLGQPGDTLQLRLAAGNPVKVFDDADFASTDESVATVDAYGLVTAVGYGECQIIAGIEPYADYCKVIVAEKWMALTFDDGPGDGTPRLLEGLRERDAYASFFVIGTMAEGRKDTLRQIVDYGHDLGNHTYNHRYTGEGLHEDLALTDAIIIDAIGYPSVLMRPPGGYIFDSTRNCGKAIVMWSIDPRDWEVRNADTVYNNIMTEAFSGAVVVMHDIYDTSIESALWVIDALKDQGYTFVTISDMFDYPEPNRICTQGYSTVRPRKWMVPDWPGRPPE